LTARASGVAIQNLRGDSQRRLGDWVALTRFLRSSSTW
jgi:hypothetical protein